MHILQGSYILNNSSLQPEPRLTMAPYNKKDRQILHYKVERPLLKRHLIKYKAY